MNTHNDVYNFITYCFDENGHLITSIEKEGQWEVQVGERELLIPSIEVRHWHARPAAGARRSPTPGTTYTYSNTSYTYLKSIDTMCICGVTFPKRIIEDVVTIVKRRIPSLYAAIERSGTYVAAGVVHSGKRKVLAKDWYLIESPLSNEAVAGLALSASNLFHICNDNHPAYLYYGRGIPLYQIAMPPDPGCCKTCRMEIPKGIRISLLMMNQKVKLK